MMDIVMFLFGATGVFFAGYAYGRDHAEEIYNRQKLKGSDIDKIIERSRTKHV